MARIGNTSVSSLMSGARAARTQQDNLNDTAAAYAFHNSAQTQEDYNAYQNYLKSRQSETVDPGKTLTLQKAADSAFSGFSSSELQRATDAINTGEGNPSQKLDRIKQLYDDAISRHDYNTAQNLQSSYISLSKSIQTQAQVAADRAQASSDRAERLAKSNYSKQVSFNVNQNAQAHADLEYSIKHGALTLADPSNPADVSKRIAAQIVTGPDGRPQLAPADKPMKLTATQYAQLKSGLVQDELNIHNQAVVDGMDESGVHSKAVKDLLISKDYQRYVNSDAIKNTYAGADAGLPFTTKVNADGSVSVEPRNLVTKQTGFDPKTFSPITAQGYKSGMLSEDNTGAEFSFDKRMGAGGDWNNYTVHGDLQQNLTNPDGSPMIDPHTGKPVQPHYSGVDPLTGLPWATFSAKQGIDGKGNSGNFNPELEYNPNYLPNANDLLMGHKVNKGDYAKQAVSDFVHSQASALHMVTHPSSLLAAGKGLLTSGIHAVAGGDLLQAQANAYRQAQATKQQQAAAAAQIAAAKATPLSQPLPAGVNYAAKYINTPIAKIPGAPNPQAPVFTPTPGKPLTPAQQTTNTVNAINKAVGFGPAYNNNWFK